jgi:hypothetical protein
LSHKKDGNGFLSLEELKGFIDPGDTGDDSVLMEVIGEVDTNKDGQVRDRARSDFGRYLWRNSKR